MKLANGNYIRPPARYSWWMRQGRYWRYMMRELSSLFIGIFCFILVWGLFRLAQGEAAFNHWTNELWYQSAGLCWLIFLFATYHSYTWFMVTPKAMPIKLNGKRVAAYIIIGAHFLLWLFASLVVWYAFIYGGNT